MTDAELDLLNRRLKESDRYFEYGSGQSTKIALSIGTVKRIVSVESDGEFIRHELLSDPAVREGLESGRLVIEEVDIGPTKRWGYPKDASRKADWPLYSSRILEGGDKWDLVLVDGRFRVACFAYAALHHPDCRILIHDFWRRGRYRRILNYSDVVETVDQLVLLKRRKGVTDAALERLARSFACIPSDKNKWDVIKSKLGFRV